MNDLLILDAFPDVADLALGVRYELVTGIEVAPWSYCHIFGSGTASRYPLIDTGTACEVKHIVIESKSVAFLIALHHLTCKALVLRAENGEIFLGKGGRAVGRCYYRLHGKLLESEVSHMEYVVYEVRIKVGESTPHVVALVAAAPYELLELRHDPVVGAVACEIHTEAVIYFLSAVEAQYHIVHLVVTEVDDIVRDADAVSSKCEADILSCFLLDRSCVLYELLYYFPVHQGLAAEEVDIEILVVARILDKEIDRTLTCLIAHYSAVTVELTLSREAVGAVEVACMSDMKADSLEGEFLLF